MINLDEAHKTWSFPLAEHDSLVQLLHTPEYTPLVTLKPIPATVLKGLRSPRYAYNPAAESSTASQDSMSQQHHEALASLPETLRTALLPFQRIGVAFAISRQGRLMIGDDMGLGKTVQAIATAVYYQSEWPLLVIAPSSLTTSWGEVRLVHVNGAQC